METNIKPISIIDILAHPDIIDLIGNKLTIEDIKNLSTVSKIFQAKDINIVFVYLLQKKKYETSLRTGTAQFYSMGNYQDHENLLADFLDIQNIEYSISFLRNKIDFSIFDFFNKISILDQAGCTYESVEDYFATYLGNYIREEGVIEKLQAIEQTIDNKGDFKNLCKTLGIPQDTYYLKYYANEYNLILRQVLLIRGTNLVYDAYIYKILKIVQKNKLILVGDIVHIELGINYALSNDEGRKQYQDYLVSWDYHTNQKILIPDDKGNSCFPPQLFSQLINNKVTYSHANTQALQLFFNTNDWVITGFFPWILPKCCDAITKAVYLVL